MWLNRIRTRRAQPRADKAGPQDCWDREECPGDAVVCRVCRGSGKEEAHRHGKRRPGFSIPSIPPGFNGAVAQLHG
jgi:hypothetical protein